MVLRCFLLCIINVCFSESISVTEKANESDQAGLMPQSKKEQDISEDMEYFIVPELSDPQPIDLNMSTPVAVSDSVFDSNLNYETAHKFWQKVCYHYCRALILKHNI